MGNTATVAGSCAESSNGTYLVVPVLAGTLTSTSTVLLVARAIDSLPPRRLRRSVPFNTLQL